MNEHCSHEAATCSRGVNQACRQSQQQNYIQYTAKNKQNVKTPLADVAVASYDVEKLVGKVLGMGRGEAHAHAAVDLGNCCGNQTGVDASGLSA